jgi:SAM-dependent methyltransferase
MQLFERARIVQFHRRRIAQFGGGTLGALGWKAPVSQLGRFDVIARVGDMTGSSVLDLGCGYGDLKAYLDERFADVTYIGVDHVPEFVEEAQRRYKGCPDTSFFRADFGGLQLPAVDYVVASGAFAYRRSDPDFFTGMIQKMYEAATTAVAFNMLDAAVFRPYDLLEGQDRERILSFCRSIAPDVRLIEDYAVDDFTVFMYAAEGAGEPEAGVG